VAKKLKKLKKFLAPENCEVIWEEVKEPHCAIEKEQVGEKVLVVLGTC
jgi:hypothetical protein